MRSCRSSSASTSRSGSSTCSFSATWRRATSGRSIVTRQPILKEFLNLFPATVELSLCALFIATIIGLPAGIIAGVNRGSTFDHALMGLSLTGYSMPIFWWALLLIIFFSGNLGWTPVSGRIDILYFFPPVTGFMLIDGPLSGQEGAFTSAVRHLILPAVVLGTIPLAVIARQTRSAMLEVLNEDYVRTARAKGLPPSRVIGLHALRNALIPVVTVIGLQVGLLFSGAILTETIFAWPGIGKWLVDSIWPARLSGRAGRRRADRDHDDADQSSGRRDVRPDQPAHQAREVSWRAPSFAPTPSRCAPRRRPARCASSGHTSARTGAPSAASS